MRVATGWSSGRCSKRPRAGERLHQPALERVQHLAREKLQHLAREKLHQLAREKLHQLAHNRDPDPDPHPVPLRLELSVNGREVRGIEVGAPPDSSSPRPAVGPRVQQLEQRQGLQKPCSCRLRRLRKDY